MCWPGRVQLRPGADLRPVFKRVHLRRLGGPAAETAGLDSVPPVSGDPKPLLAAVGGGCRQADLPSDRPPAPGAHPGAGTEKAGGCGGGQRVHRLSVLPAAALGRAAGHCAVPGGRHRTAERHRADRHPADPSGADPLDRTVCAGAVPFPAFAAAAIRHDPAAELSL